MLCLLTAGGVLCHACHEGHASEDRFGNCQEGEVSQSAASLSESEVFIDPKNIHNTMVNKLPTAQL